MPGHNSTLLYFAITFEITIVIGKKEKKIKDGNGI